MNPSAEEPRPWAPSKGGVSAVLPACLTPTLLFWRGGAIGSPWTFLWGSVEPQSWTHAVHLRVLIKPLLCIPGPLRSAQLWFLPSAQGELTLILSSTHAGARTSSRHACPLSKSGLACSGDPHRQPSLSEWASGCQPSISPGKGKIYTFYESSLR